MDCRTFQKNHVAYVDDLLPAVHMEAMHRHRRDCATCGRHDSLERRALMLARSLPRIDPSPEFSMRLNARLRADVPALALAPRLSPSRALVAATACAAVLAVAAIAGRSAFRSAPPLMHAPVTAVMPRAEPQPSFTGEALVASVSTGMPMIPVALLADQVPVQFANTEFRLTSFSR